MSFTFDVIVNPIIMVAGVIIGAIIGFVVGKAKLARTQSKISKLETELLNSHSETLEAQQAFVALERRLVDQTIPVISMKINGSSKEPAKEKLSK